MTEQEENEIFETYKIPISFRKWLKAIAKNQCDCDCNGFMAGFKGYLSHFCTEFMICYNNHLNSQPRPKKEKPLCPNCNRRHIDVIDGCDMVYGRRGFRQLGVYDG